MNPFDHDDMPDMISRLPIQVAILAGDIRAEKNPRLQLWIGLELFETTLKWLFAVMSSAIYAHNGKLPKALANTVANSIHKPTLAGWIAMTAVAAQEVRRVRVDDGFGVPFADFFERYGDGTESEFTWSRLKEFRTKVVHGGGITEAKAREQMTQLGPALRDMVRGLAEVHVDYDTVAIFDGVALLLEGLEPKRLTDDTPKGEDPGTWLIRKDGLMAGLQPILTYEPIQEFWEVDIIRSVDDDTAPPVPQWYFKYENDQLFYTPIGVDDFVSVQRDTSRFERVFPAREANAPLTVLAQQYTQARKKHVARFVGRRREVNRVLRWLNDTVPAGNRLGLIVAGPGLGKSALIASAALEYRDTLDDIRTRRNHSIFHAFSSDNPQNDRRLFLMNLCQEMQRWLGQEVETRANLSDPNSLLQKAQSLLEKSRKLNGKRHLAVFVDALDEVVLFDPGFPDVLTRLAGAGVTVVATMRQERWLLDFEKAKSVERITFLRGSDELPGMDEDDIRGLLLDRLDRQAREIIALDNDVSEGDRAHNPFIATVVRLAEGKPLYIELLIADIENGDARIEANPRLPKRLEEFYGKLLGRQGVGDAKAHLAIILCLLALVREPVEERWLAHLLSLSPTSQLEASAPSAWVSNALRDGQVFLSRTEPGAGSAGLSLYHQELRRFLEGERKTGANGLQWAFGMARWLLASAVVGSETLEDKIIVGHFRRHGAEYVLTHGDDVFPRPLQTSAAEFIKRSYLSRNRLPQVIKAWADDREAFINSFARVMEIYRRKASPEDIPAAFAEFVSFILCHPKFENSASVVHSVLGYREEEKWIYRGILENVLSEPSEESATEAFRRTEWMVVAGGAERRAGGLNAASNLLARAESRLEARRDVPAREWYNASSVLHYEMGYVAYSRSDFSGAAEEFARSVEAAKQSENPVSEHISEAVRRRVAIVADLAGGGTAAEGLEKFKLYLDVALKRLLETVRSDPEERNRLNAERWVMNCHAHLFEIAWYERNVEEALHHYENWFKDPWVAKAGEKAFNALHEKIAPRINRLRGDTEEALVAYRALLPPLHDENSPDACRESIAEFYLEYAEFCIELSMLEEARAAARSGLLTNDAFANAGWKAQIRNVAAPT